VKIVKTKEISPISEIPDSLVDFKDRAKLHDGNIPDFFVYIQDYAWNAFWSHSNNVYKEIRHEAQGIFTGNYYKDQWGEFVIATRYHEGSGGSTSSFVEMSEECLAKISEKCQKDNSLMIIWIHTHPGFGVFYSGTDYNCLRTNFYKPYQVGLVVDILKKQHKGFKSKGNEVVDFTDYKLFNDEKNILLDPFPIIKIVKESDRRISELEEENKRLKEENETLKKKLSEKSFSHYYSPSSPSLSKGKKQKKKTHR
jgi:proteasome lid subunit RPN8/RPN11